MVLPLLHAISSSYRKHESLTESYGKLPERFSDIITRNDGFSFNYYEKSRPYFPRVFHVRSFICHEKCENGKIVENHARSLLPSNCLCLAHMLKMAKIFRTRQKEMFQFCISTPPRGHMLSASAIF